MNVLIIGAGNMGLTYGQSFVDASVVSRDKLYFLEKDEAKAIFLDKISNNPLHSEPSVFMKNMDLVVLAVKPQDFSTLAINIKPFLHEEHLILSIMAGVTIDTIQSASGCRRVVRAMPNLPAQIGMGMTVFTTSEEVKRQEIFLVQNLLNTTGKTLYTPNEAMLDAATAVSGSGPAFVFFFMQSMIDAAKYMGFSESEAQLLVSQTFRGSVNLLYRNNFSCEEWIKRVSSKGGTTEAAMEEFASHDLGKNIQNGLEAALKRAIELSVNE